MPPAATAPRPPSGVGGRQNLSGPDVLEIFRTDKSTLYLILWPFPPPGHAIKMIQLKTMLNCIDNSGAAVVECVNVLKKKRPATVGDRIVVVVQKQRNFGPESSNNSGIANKVRRGDIRHAVVVRAKKEMQRPDGSIVKFDDNACVLVNKSGDPIGTRMNGVVATELRGKQWSKILSLAPMHV